jgi:DNA repair ATPase RecN
MIMIKSIELKNIQSHEDTTLNLHSGINALRGESEQGKTAILRGLYWIVSNRPIGNVLLSHWARNDKGNVEKETSARLTVDQGFVERFKTKDENGYRIEGRELTAIKTEVPNEIPEILNFSESAIHRQMDGPFLLSQSPGEVARYLNRVLKMDVIDRLLSHVESEKRRVNSELKLREGDLKKVQEDLEGFEWVPKAERIMSRIEEMDERREAAEELAEDMDASVRKYCETSARFNRYDRMDQVDKDFERIGKLIAKKKELAETQTDMIYSCEKWERLTEQNRQYKKLDEAAETFAELEKHLVLWETVCSDKGVLLEALASFKDGKGKVKELTEQIQELESQLPETCPLCGGKL